MSLETGTVYVTEQNIPVIIPKGISIFGFTVSFFGICLVFAALAGLFVVQPICNSIVSVFNLAIGNVITVVLMVVGLVVGLIIDAILRIPLIVVTSLMSFTVILYPVAFIIDWVFNILSFVLTAFLFLLPLLIVSIISPIITL